MIPTSQRGFLHYKKAGNIETLARLRENPCSLSSFEEKHSHDPVTTLGQYNKEQTPQVNPIQSHLFSWRELESINGYQE